ncbi:GIY-YIG nuclease family protein [Parapedobacter pyrenivorans]|uniref:GIY-YIG nuclease family protein n=1 Tax=Parapedobacter pyrenivorans TaxID=1305674 RepID=UPI0033420F96
MHYLYIIYSTRLDRYYIGACKDIPQRLRRHNSQHRGFTGKADDWHLVYHEVFTSKTAAMAREREIKSWKSRRMVENLIAGT